MTATTDTTNLVEDLQAWIETDAARLRVLSESLTSRKRIREAQESVERLRVNLMRLVTVENETVNGSQSFAIMDADGEDGEDGEDTGEAHCRYAAEARAQARRAGFRIVECLGKAQRPEPCPPISVLRNFYEIIWETHCFSSWHHRFCLRVLHDKPHGPRSKPPRASEPYPPMRAPDSGRDRGLDGASCDIRVRAWCLQNVAA
jgi:hypothetical protein